MSQDALFGNGGSSGNGKDDGTAASLVPSGADLDVLRSAAAGCQACDLWRLGTQTVFGEGVAHADLMLVGEQPGDMEDRAGRPFVGPAGKLLDRALTEAGIDRSAVYVTNAVKHFKWKPAGKRRLHQKPNAAEVHACRPWLEAEVAVVKPKLIACLGGTAAQALIGRDFRVTRQRGQFLQSAFGCLITATVHPSSILRADDRDAEMAAFVADLKVIADRLS